jgi:hypothetical protein
MRDIVVVIVVLMRPGVSAGVIGRRDVTCGGVVRG